MPKRIKVIQENESGRNTNFHDNFNGNNMTQTEFVQEIKNGNYPNYHVRNINGIDTPVSNPDPKHDNNLG